MDAYWAWHCGNETADCHGEELIERSDGQLHCPGCRRIYDSNDGSLAGRDTTGPGQHLIGEHD